jgi:E3 ubiquitin-protein ligase RBBP6
MDATEEEKIKAMMSQSTADYDPSKYQKIRGSGQHGRVPPHYRCNKCHNVGHWIKDCPYQVIILTHQNL